jgi:hypothetical protein
MIRILKAALLASLLAACASSFAAVRSCPANPPVKLGLSTDTKPTAGNPPCALFFETDTDQTFMWIAADDQGTSGNWVLWGQGITIREMPNPSSYSTAYGADQDSQGGTTTYTTAAAGSVQLTTAASKLTSVFNATGTTITVRFWDDEDGTCDENSKSGVISLTNSAPPLLVGWEFTNGICMLTTGTSPTITTTHLP